MDRWGIQTKYGRADVRVHRVDGGWVAMLVGRHLVPAPPCLDGPLAQSEVDAVTQLARAIDRVCRF